MEFLKSYKQVIATKSKIWEKQETLILGENFN